MTDTMGIVTIRNEFGKQAKFALLQDIHKTWIADIRGVSIFGYVL